MGKRPASSTPAAAKKPASKPQQPSISSLEPNPKDSPKPTQAKDQTNGARKAKPAAADPVTPTMSAAQKRSAEVKVTDGNASKKPKQNAEPEPEKKSTDTPNKSIFERFWSEEDELVILRGMIDYKDEKKAHPAAQLDAFFDFIKKSLSGKDFDKTQLKHKLRRLKKKYAGNKIREEKMEKDGKEMTFLKPHEQSSYELSKSVWGNQNVSGSDSEPNPKDSPIPTLAAGKKRSAEAKAADGKATKKPKKNAEPEPEVKSIIERFWSEEDELVILQGMIDFTDEKKANPAADMNAFLEFIKKKSLSKMDFNKTQLKHKIKRLKKKYADKKVREEKMEKDGKEMTFSKPHLQSAYGLSKIVWGNKKDVKESDIKV